MIDDNLIFSNQIDPVLGPVIVANNILPVLPYRSTDVSAGFNVNNFSCFGTPSTKLPGFLKAITGCEFYNFDLGVAVHHFQSLSTYSFYQDSVNHPMKLTFNFLSLLKNNSNEIIRSVSVVFRKELQSLQSYNATSVKNIILTNFDFGRGNGKINQNNFNLQFLTNWFEKMKLQNCNPDLVTFLICFDGFARRADLKSAESILVLMKIYKIEFDKQNKLANTFLKVCGKSNDPERA